MAEEDGDDPNCVVPFHETFEVPATLYKASSGPSSPFGPFKKKCIILAILETDGRTKATAALGRVVIDLSEYTAVDGKELRCFEVACNKAIHSAVGQPQLTVTVRCRWKKTGPMPTSGPVGPSDAMSMSTDTTGSALTQNLESFMRNGRVASANGSALLYEREQDLHGFRTQDLEPIPEADVHSDEGPDSARVSAEHCRRAVLPEHRTFTLSATALAQAGLVANAGLDDSDLEDSSPNLAYTAGHSALDTWLGLGQGTASAQPQSTGGSKRANAADLWDQDSPRPAALSEHSSPGSSSDHSSRLCSRASTTTGTASSPSSLAITAPEMHIPHPPAAGHSQRPCTNEPPFDQPRRSHGSDASGAAAHEWEPHRHAAPGSQHGQSKPAAQSQQQDTAAACNADQDDSRGRQQPQPARERWAMGGGDSTAAAGLRPLDQRTSRALKLELVGVAVLEASLYLGRLLQQGGGGRRTHAPARRIARTIVCLGPRDGTAFGRNALQVMAHLVQHGSSDLDTLAFWWSNCVHLRGFMQSMSLSATAKAGSEAVEHWATREFMQPLLELEELLFQQVLSWLWWRVLVPAVVPGSSSTTHSLGSSGTSPTHAGLPAAAAGTMATLQPSLSLPTSLSSPSNIMALSNGVDAGHAPRNRWSNQQACDRAVRRWTSALNDVAACLPEASRHNHMDLLRRQVLLHCLHRTDTTLLAALVPGVSEVSRFPKYEATAPVSQCPMPVLDDGAMPFVPGRLAFGVGMHIKMAVTRLQQWAFEEVIMRQDGSPVALDGISLFPQLRAAADLLMMPKQLLRDASIRQDVCSALSMQVIAHMAESFAPDEFTPEVISADVVAMLRQQVDSSTVGHSGMGNAQASSAARSRSRRRAAHQAEEAAAYIPPSDDVVMRHVEAGEDPGLEYDFDSEADLEEAACLATSCDSALNGPRSLRYCLLHELWMSGVPRQSAMTIQRLSSRTRPVPTA